MDKCTGVVKFFASGASKYGFIRCYATGIDYYFTLLDCEEPVKKYDRVVFTPGQGKRGPRARDIQLIDHENSTNDI